MLKLFPAQINRSKIRMLNLFMDSALYLSTNCMHAAIKMNYKISVQTFTQVFNE